MRLDCELGYLKTSQGQCVGTTRYIDFFFLERIVKSNIIKNNVILCDTCLTSVKEKHDLKREREREIRVGSNKIRLANKVERSNINEFTIIIYHI